MNKVQKAEYDREYRKWPEVVVRRRTQARRYSKSNKGKASRFRYWHNPANLQRKYDARVRSEEKKGIRNFLANVKTQFGCCLCGEDDFRCLEFHHLDPSEKSSSMGKISHGHRWGVVEEELAKCEVYCANCHAILTYEAGHRLVRRK